MCTHIIQENKQHSLTARRVFRVSRPGCGWLLLARALTRLLVARTIQSFSAVQSSSTFGVLLASADMERCVRGSHKTRPRTATQSCQLNVPK